MASLPYPLNRLYTHIVSVIATTQSTDMETATLYYEPNVTTIAAIEEARSGKELETLDLDNFKSFVDSL